MYNKLQTSLYYLWGGIVKKYHIDLFNSEIRFEGDVIDQQKDESFTLSFKGVTSVYYLNKVYREFLTKNKITDDAHDEDDDFLLELTSIDYYPEGIGSINISSKEDWSKEYGSAANFALEFSLTILLIEAQIIEINGECFSTKLP